MKPETKKEMKKLLGQVSVDYTAVTYVLELLKLYARSPEVFQEICEQYDLEEEELVQFLRQINHKNILIYDEMLDYSHKILKKEK